MTRRVATTVNLDNEPSSAMLTVDHVYEMLLQAIVESTYPSGERLLIERLADELGVSEQLVREAVDRLETNGHVRIAPSFGAAARSIDLDLYPEMVEAVALLESLALGLAVPNLTTHDIRIARGVNEELRACLQDPELDLDRYSRLNQRFHEILFGACPNRHIMAILDREWALLETTRESRFVFMPDRAADRVREHDELLDMIEQHRSVGEIEHFALDHRMGTPRRLLRDLSDLIGSSAATAV